MEIVYREEDLLRYMNDAVRVSEDSPVLLDRFLSAAIEVDIDAVSDGEAGRDWRHHAAYRAGGRALR